MVSKKSVLRAFWVVALAVSSSAFAEEGNPADMDRIKESSQKITAGPKIMTACANERGTENRIPASGMTGSPSIQNGHGNVNAPRF